MTWIELDDRILEHPKFLRAVNAGGSDAVHLWLGIKAYCNQQLTDGFVPDDILTEVRGPRDPKRRKAALEALRNAGLLEAAEGGVQMHDYLQWSRSRIEVLEGRKRATERKARSRGRHGVTDSVTDSVAHGVTARGLTGVSQTPLPSPIPDLSASLRDPRDPKEDRTDAKDLTGFPRVEAPAARPLAQNPQETWDGSERETACPLDLAEKAERLKVTEQLAEALRVDLVSVRESVREFVGYWTIGAGMGQKRRHWMRKLREHVRRAAGKPGGLAPPGRIEHESRDISPTGHDSREELRALARLDETRRLYELGKAQANAQRG